MNTSGRNYFGAGSLRMVALLVLVACSSLSSGCEKKGPVPVGVAAYNHTDETIFDFSVNDAAVGRVIVPHAGGGYLLFVFAEEVAAGPAAQGSLGYKYGSAV